MAKKTKKTNDVAVFISGSSKVTDKQFVQFYYPMLNQLINSKDPVYFIIDDDGIVDEEGNVTGVGAFCQIVFSSLPKNKQNRVTVFYSDEKPHLYLPEGTDIDFRFTPGRFHSKEERNAAMTVCSNQDLHILFGYDDEDLIKENICRRNYPYGYYDYDKYTETGYADFWKKLLNKNESIHEEVPSQDTQGDNTEA